MATQVTTRVTANECGLFECPDCLSEYASASAAASCQDQHADDRHDHR